MFHDELDITDAEFVVKSTVQLVRIKVHEFNINVSTSWKVHHTQSNVKFDAAKGTELVVIVLVHDVALSVIVAQYVLVIPAVHQLKLRFQYIFNAELQAHVTFVASAGSGQSIVKSLQLAVVSTVTV